MTQLHYLVGKKMCIVFCKLVGEENLKKGEEPKDGQFQISTLHGKAKLDDQGYLRVEDDNGDGFNVPQSAYKNIHPSDGTDILKDADYFVMVKVSGMDLH